MIIYFAGESPVDNTVLVKNGVKNLLKSYFYLKDNPKYTIELMSQFNVFIDSGAFSALTQQAMVNIDLYCNFIKQYKPVVYAGLDVIGDAIATKKNMAYMESKGLKPIPTFHRKSELSYLYEMLDLPYDYIALGGIAITGLSSKQRHLHLDRCWKQIRSRRPDVKVHGFGCSGERIMREYPWYSVDSTSWLAPVRFDREIEGRSNRDIIVEHTKLDERAWYDRGVQREAILAKSIQYYLRLEREVTEKHNTGVFENLTQGDLFE